MFGLSRTSGWFVMAGSIAFLVLIFLIINFSDVLTKPVRYELYNPTDRVTLLDADNFSENVYNSSSGWLVQFFNSWCGHCITFSSTWKAFASDIYNWKDVIVVSGIDCADDHNTQLCRNYEIMAYPTIRFFPPHLTNQSTGKDVVRRGSVSELRREVLILLQRSQMELANSSKPFDKPYLLPVVDNTTLQRAFSLAPEQRGLLVVEDSKSMLGAELILDLMHTEWLVVRRVLAGSFPDLLQNATAPIVYFATNSSYEIISFPKNPSRQEVYSIIRDELMKKGLVIKDVLITANHTEEQFRVKQSESQLIQVNQMFRGDLYSTLQYSLVHEISSKFSFSDEMLANLHYYLQVVIKFFPALTANDRSFLLKLDDFVGTTTNLTGKEFSKQLSELRMEMKPDFMMNPVTWIGCRGSMSRYRRFPCGLWMTFHSMTVSAYENSQLMTDHTEVLKAIRGYVKSFFGCTGCSDHFQNISKNLEAEVKSLDESVLWLWDVHNAVNKRLAGDLSQDPAFPKVQFPVKKMCQQCYTEQGHWNKSAVLDYIIGMYSASHMKNNGTTSDWPVAEPKASRLQSDQKDDGWNISLNDTKTCIIIYLLWVGLLVVLTLKLFLRKRAPRQKPRTDFFGKTSFLSNSLCEVLASSNEKSYFNVKSS